MKYIDSHKLIFAGNKIQTYSYSLPVICKEDKKEKISQRRKLSFEEKAENRKNYLKKVATAIDRIIWTNPDMNIFITLTFKENITKPKRANYLFNQFVQRYNYHNPNNKLKYLAVVEFQKRGAVHYHLLIDRYIDKKILEKLWGYGLTRIEYIRGGPNQMRNYLIKYLNKTSYLDSRLWRKKMYFKSENIRKYFEKKYDDPFNVGNVIQWYIIHNNREVIKESKNSYNANFIGEIEYREIILKNKSDELNQLFTQYPCKK